MIDYKELAGLRICLAEDDDSIRNVIAEYLKSYQCIVYPVTNGLDAIEIALTQDLDLIISDFNMPRCGAKGILMLLSELSASPPVLVISALDRYLVKAALSQAASFEILEKPFLLEELLEAVVRIIDP